MEKILAKIVLERKDDLMARNIVQQLDYAIEKAKSFGTKKRALKFDAGTEKGKEALESKIVSLSRYCDMKKLAANFGNYLRENFPAVKRATDIEEKHIDAYLRAKAVTNNSTAMPKVMSNIRKLENVARSAFPGSVIDWGTQRVVMPKAKDVINYQKTNPISMELSASMVSILKSTGRSEAWRGLEVGRHVGMRVGEVVKLKVENIHLYPEPGDKHDRWGFGYVEILAGPAGGAKGGRPRKIPIYSQEAREAIEKAIAGKQPEDYVVTSMYRGGGPITTDGMNKRLGYALEKLEIADNYKGDKMHGCRKAWAQIVYDITRKEGGDQKKARAVTNELLGHSAKREVVETYVANMW